MPKIRKNATPRLADALVKAEMSERDAPIDPSDLLRRASMTKAVIPAQIEYLRQMSPAAASAWEAGRNAA